MSNTSLCTGYLLFCLTIRTMEQERFKEILEIGETIRVEFKRCGNGIESDTYETVCSFLNRLAVISFRCNRFRSCCRRT